MNDTDMTLRHQNFMWAVRQEMGWPLFKPMNDCLAFCSGRPCDVEVGMELGRIAQTLRKDIVYSGWADARAAEPETFTVVLRELLKISVIDRCFLWATDARPEMILVSTRSDESFAVGPRGLLVRLEGKPSMPGAGRKLAMKRIRATVAAMGDELARNNVSLPHGADWVEPEAPGEIVVSFN